MSTVGGASLAASDRCGMGERRIAGAFPWAMLYAALYVLLTWPLLLHPSRFIVASNGDGFFDMLLFWYARHGLLLAPHVSGLFYPWGVPLGVDKVYWLVPLLSVPLQWLMPLPVVFNLIGAAFFLATALAAWFLARDLGAGEGGAFVAGAFLVLSPAYLNEMSQGIPENMAVCWLLLFLRYALRAPRRVGSPVARPAAKGVDATHPETFSAARAETSHPDRAGLWCGLFFVLCWLTSWYLGLLAALFIPFLPFRRLAPSLGVAAGVVLLVVLPLLTMRARFQSRYDPRQTGRLSWTEQASADVLRNCADFSGLLARDRPWRMRDTLPGLLLIGLALLGAVRRPRNGAVFPWGRIAFLFALLSLGPALVWNGIPRCPTPFTMAYHLLPVLARMRPARFLLGVSLALAMLAAFAVPRFRSRRLALGVGILLVTLQGVETTYVIHASYRIRLASATVDAGYRLLTKPGGVIDVPLLPNDLAVGQHLYAQTLHRHPMLNYDFVSLQSVRALVRKARRFRILGMLLRDEAGSEGAGMLRLMARDVSGGGVAEAQGVAMKGTGGGTRGASPAPIASADALALRALGFRYLILHTRMPQDGDAPTCCFGAPLYAKLRALYGRPRTGVGGLLVFDLDPVARRGGQAVSFRPVLLGPEGGIPSDAVQRIRRPLLLDLAAAASDRGRRAWELAGWLRGAGTRLVVWERGRWTPRARVRGIDWTWIHMRLSGPCAAPPAVYVLPPSGGEAQARSFWLSR